MHTYSSCMVSNPLVDFEPVDEPGFSLLHDYAVELFLEALSPLCFTCRL